jgi:hypothetical protein
VGSLLGKGQNFPKIHQDTAGVTGSNPVPPTKSNPPNPLILKKNQRWRVTSMTGGDLSMTFGLYPIKNSS